MEHKKCDKKLQDNDTLYEICDNVENDLNDNTDCNKGSFFRALMKHRRLAIVLSVLFVLFLFSMVWYINSGIYLSNKLINYTWYQCLDIKYDGGYISKGSIVDFYADGKADYRRYIEYGSGGMHLTGESKPRWEVLKDKTLLFDGDYYEWKEEWSLRGQCLEIGSKTYFANNDFYYSDVD